MDVLTRIKRLVLGGRIRFTEKSRDEMECNHLTRADVIESIANAQVISKTIRSRSQATRYTGEKLYVIKSFNYSGTLIYTKGAIIQEGGLETFYIIISSKISTVGG